MKDEKRRRRFLAWFAQRYGDDRARFMRDTGFTKGRVTQFFDPDEPFGERAGASIARRVGGLAEDFFERDPYAPAAPVAALVAREPLPADRWRQVANIAAELLDEQGLRVNAAKFLQFVDVFAEQYAQQDGSAEAREAVRRHLRLVA